jgi:putative transposase
MTGDVCLEALEEAIAQYGPPEIVNSDQGSQFTSNKFTGVLSSPQGRRHQNQHGRQGALDR